MSSWGELWGLHTAATDRLAISEHDVYDSFYDEEEDFSDPPEPHQGPWYHYSPHSLPVGTHLTTGHDSPWGDNYYEKDGTEHRRNYVWLSPSLGEAVGWAGMTPRRGQTGPGHIYRVEPHSDVLPWNGTGSDGWVAEGAHIAEEIPHPWKEPHTASTDGWGLHTANWDSGISHDDQGREGVYTVNDGGYKAGDLWYTLAGGKAHVDSITVHPDYRGGGVGQSLIERLHQDFPAHKINPGTTTQAGHDFMRRMQQLPHLADAFDPDWEPDIFPPHAGNAYDQHHINRLDPEYYRDDDDEHRTAAKAEHWYHASQHELPVGTVLTPGGGDSEYGNYYDRTGEGSERGQHVWVDTLKSVRSRWSDPDTHYVYKVEPHEPPQLYMHTNHNGVTIGGEHGYTTPAATITKLMRRPRTASTDGIRYAHIVEADVADDLRRLAGLNGDLPEGLTFQYHPEGFEPFPDVIQPNIPLSNAWPTVSAHDGDRMIGHLQWDGDHPRKKGEIWDLRVHPDYHRRGVATALFDWTTDQVEPDLHHSRNLSDEGRAFAEAEDARPLARQREEAWRNGQPMPKRFAALNQDLVNRLDKQFHDWWTDTFAARYKAGAPEVKSYLKYGDPDGGPITHWPAIEAFLKERYPAAHKGHDMGLEEAGHILDGKTPMPYQQRGKADLSPYVTGPEAETTHGYDPKEIAAGMLLLHNRSNPFRGDMEQRDVARLTDIVQKRTQMQRSYDQRKARIAAAPDEAIAHAQEVLARREHYALHGAHPEGPQSLRGYRNAHLMEMTPAWAAETHYGALKQMAGAYHQAAERVLANPDDLDAHLRLLRHRDLLRVELQHSRKFAVPSLEHFSQIPDPDRHIGGQLINPRFKAGTGDPDLASQRAYMINCQRCALAADANYHGLNVEAQQRYHSPKGGHTNDYFPQDHELAAWWRDANGVPAAWIDPQDDFAQGDDGPHHWDHMTRQIASWGPGARAVIVASYPHPQSNQFVRHVFNARVGDTGQVHYIDHQIRGSSGDHYRDRVDYSALDGRSRRKNILTTDPAARIVERNKIESPLRFLRTDDKTLAPETAKFLVDRGTADGTPIFAPHDPQGDR